MARPIDEAFAYIKDFTTTTEWDATALRATKKTAGEIRVGTEFEVVCALPVGSITLLYRVRTLEPNALIELDGSCRFFDIRDKISFKPSKRGTQITYRAEFEFKPIIKPFAGLSKNGLVKMGWESVAGLAEALEDNYPVPESSGAQASGHFIISELSMFTRLGYTLGKKRFHPMSTSVRGKHMEV